MYLESAGGQYLIWDGAEVYIVKGSEYYQSSLALPSPEASTLYSTPIMTRTSREGGGLGSSSRARRNKPPGNFFVSGVPDRKFCDKMGTGGKFPGPFQGPPGEGRAGDKTLSSGNKRVCRAQHTDCGRRGENQAPRERFFKRDGYIVFRPPTGRGHGHY